MKKVQPLLVLFIFSIIITACAAPPPTPSPEAEQAQLATMVAATVEAALANPNADGVPAAPMDGEPDPAAAESATALQDAPAVPAPIIYPDFQGLRVAYLNDGNVYVWTEGGSPIGITSTGDATQISISPDGSLVAYVRELADIPFAYELWVVNSDGGPLNPQMLVSHAEMEALRAASPFTNAEGFDFDQLVWRPGTHNLYYNTVPRFMGPGYAPSYDLRIVNVDTLAKSTLFEFEQAGAFKFSPDGSQLVLTSPEHISLVNADGSNLRANVLNYPIVATYSEYQYVPSPIWAADSMSLRVAVPPADSFAEPTPPTNLWYLPVDGSAATQLVSIPSIPFDWPDHTFSPDMSFIAYTRSIGDPTENQRELHIAYADGTNDYVFTSGTTLYFYGWTPDSTRFIYQMHAPDDRGVYVGSIVDGSSYTFTSDSSFVHSMAWVDNSRVIFVYENPSTGTSELRISDQGGTNHAFIDTLTGGFPQFDFTK